MSSDFRVERFVPPVRLPAYLESARNHLEPELCRRKNPSMGPTSPDRPLAEQTFLDVLGTAEPSEEARLYDLCLAIENIVTSYDDRLDAF